MMEFGEKLQQLRKQQGFTQEELAQRLYVSRTAVSKWESGRGYPEIDSLKAISRLFAVSVDELLSGDELISLAENENREKAGKRRDMLFGLLDTLAAALFFLPLFGQPEGERVLFVPVFALTDRTAFVWAFSILLLTLTALLGVAQLALLNAPARPWWAQGKLALSLFLSALGTLFFIACLQPYAAAFLFFMLLIKGVLLIKQR